MNTRVPFSIDAPASAAPGWSAQGLDGAAAESHRALSALKEKLILEFDAIVRQKRSCELSFGDLETEYIKSAVRSILRYSSEARHFARQLFRRLTAHAPRYTEFFLTPPYLIFHTPNDKLEIGTIHLDTIREGGEMFTCWTPINERQLTYAALSFFEGSHAFLPHIAYRIARKLRVKAIPEEAILRLVGVTRRDLVPARETSYFWHSDLLHIGNENTGGVAHCAMVFRVSCHPLYYEPSVRCGELVNGSFGDTANPALGDVADKIFAAAGLATSAPCLTDYNEAAGKWIDSVYAQKAKHDVRTAKYLSFACALIAQRFPAHPLAHAYDLMSFIYGRENLVGLERLLSACAKAGNLERMLAMLGRVESFDSVQEMTLLGKFNARLQTDGRNAGASGKLLSWLN
jgi:hypothetical protein